MELTTRNEFIKMLSLGVDIDNALTLSSTHSYDYVNNNLCVNYKIAREQRTQELLRGEGLKGTSGFNNMGCYDCKGMNNNCNSYVANSYLFNN